MHEFARVVEILVQILQDPGTETPLPLEMKILRDDGVCVGPEKENLTDLGSLAKVGTLGLSWQDNPSPTPPPPQMKTWQIWAAW